MDGRVDGYLISVSVCVVFGALFTLILMLCHVIGNIVCVYFVGGV
jgi:hypothetical protein